MDYSLLYVKAKHHKKNETPLKKMPALIYIKNKDGNNRL